MKKGFTCSRRLAAAAVLSLGSTAVAWNVRQGQINHARVLAREASAREQSIRSKIEALSDYSDLRRESLVQEVGRLESRLGPVGTLEQLNGKLGGRWRIASSEQEGRSHFVGSSVFYSLTNAMTEDWGEVLKAVDCVEALPGAAVTHLELRMGGEHRADASGHVRMGVSLLMKKEAREIPIQ